MEDTDYSLGYPTGANAAVIEAVGLIGCVNPYETVADVESQSVSFVSGHLQVVVEVTPQSYCDTLSAYENVIGTISAYVKSNTSSSNFTRYWGGFMLDEEPNYWGSTYTDAYNAYISLNGWAFLNYVYSTEAPFIEIGNWSGAWSQAEFNNLLMSGMSVAPQVYNTFITSETNTYVNDGYAYLGVLVTCDPSSDSGLSPPYTTCSGAAGTVTGSPWQYSTWGSGYWYNEWLDNR
jgi:hypothetical protein